MTVLQHYKAYTTQLIQFKTAPYILTFHLILFKTYFFRIYFPACLNRCGAKYLKIVLFLNEETLVALL